LDYLRKLEHARTVEGTSYIHVFAPCPVGWGYETAETIAVAKKAVDCGLWYLAEYADGKFVLNHNPGEFASIRDYLFGQTRFRHLQEEDVSDIEIQRDAKWARIRRQWSQ
ncbi:MAG: pyruvate synthase subunit beta, partial [Chlorobium sp.]